MDSKTQPLLTDIEANLSGPEHSHPAPSPPVEQCCARCSAHLEPRTGNITFTRRFILILLAIFFSVAIFSLVVAQMAEGRRASVIGVLTALWTSSTIIVLGLLLYAGRRPGHKLGRTIVQVYVLCVLAFTCILLLVGIVSQNISICARHSYPVRWSNGRTTWHSYADSVGCGLFTTADVLTWFLVITCESSSSFCFDAPDNLQVFGVAYATYRRAVTIHGNNTTLVPVAAWRLSSAGEVGGAIKI
ncbi:hypothetical protein C8R45DRAFT_1034832 [Mycena sanguinolenta]|nr:hypothetical protein C8R45DRAFT_1034832 [Mycena sanguinolenta]